MKHNDFLSAGVSRWEDAVSLYNQDRFLGACYLGGYTVECILKYQIMKKINIDFLQFEADLKRYNESKQGIKEDLSNGRQVTLFGHTFNDIDSFNNIAGHFKNLKHHKIRELIELAIKLDILDKTNRVRLDKGAPLCQRWDAQWRYGVPYLMKFEFISAGETVTEEKAWEFLKQVEWLINELKSQTHDVRINIDRLERSV